MRIEAKVPFRVTVEIDNPETAVPVHYDSVAHLHRIIEDGKTVSWGIHYDPSIPLSQQRGPVLDEVREAVVVALMNYAETLGKE